MCNDGEDRPAFAVRLGAFEHHPGVALTELEQAHVVGEERAVLDVPSGLVTAGAGGPAQDAADQLADAGQAEADHAPLRASTGCCGSVS